MTTNAILTTEGLKTMSAQQSKSASAPEARRPALECRDCPRRRPRWEVRLWGLEHGRILPAIVRGAASTPGERAVFPQARRRRASGISCLPALPSQAFSGNAEADGVKAICRFIEQHLDEPVTLERLGKEFRQSPFHLQRRFKAVLGSRRASTRIPAACGCSSAVCRLEIR